MGCRRTASGGLFRVVLDLVLLSHFVTLKLETLRLGAFVPGGQRGLRLNRGHPSNQMIARPFQRASRRPMLPSRGAEEVMDRRELLGTAAAPPATPAPPNFARAAAPLTLPLGHFAQDDQRAAASTPIAVDAAIVLAADVSRSIDDEEFALQRRGYADAIQSQQLIDAISTGPHGAIALSYVEWAGDGEERLVIDWAVIRNPTAARAFAAAMAGAPRSYLGRTAIGTAIDFSFALFAESAFETNRRVIDVSGDGTNHQGRLLTGERAVINGLAIFNKKAAAMGGYLALHTNPPGGLANYYRENVIGGPGAFVVQIDDFKTFGEAMMRKLVNEVADAGQRAG